MTDLDGEPVLLESESGHFDYALADRRDGRRSWSIGFKLSSGSANDDKLASYARDRMFGSGANAFPFPAVAACLLTTTPDSKTHLRERPRRSGSHPN